VTRQVRKLFLVRVDRNFPLLDQIFNRANMVEVSVRQDDGLRFCVLAEMLLGPMLYFPGGKKQAGVYQCPPTARRRNGEKVDKEDSQALHPRCDVIKGSYLIKRERNFIHTYSCLRPDRPELWF